MSGFPQEGKKFLQELPQLSGVISQLPLCGQNIRWQVLNQVLLVSLEKMGVKLILCIS